MKSVQSQVQNLLDELVGQGREEGLQVAVYYQGQQVVDAFAGLADPAKGSVVKSDTLFPVFSTTKGIAATAIHILAEKGLLEYDQPIAQHWPEFAVSGKSPITWRQALNHTAGLPHMPDCTRQAELNDWHHMCRLIAQLQPLWPPGTKTHYHAITFSWLLGEPARRADGRDFSTIITDEIARPLGLDRELFVGLPADQDHRVALMLPSLPPPSSVIPPTPLPSLAPTPLPKPVDLVAGRAIPPLVLPLEEWINQTAVQRACIASSNGIMTANAIAKHYAALIGPVDGVQLVSPPTLLQATTATATGEPENVLRGLGYELSGPAGDRGSSFGHGGAGGSIGSADIRNRLAIGLAKNRMSSHQSGEQIVRCIRKGLKLDQ